jgi:endonuclease YncB( thermonuclease family)
VKISLALIVLLTAPVPAFAQTDSDTKGTRTTHGFSVSDGDTVKFGKQLIRLFEIDAPEKLQPCDDGKWFPEPLATEALVRIIAGRPVSCRQVDYGRKNNRPVAQCYALTWLPRDALRGSRQQLAQPLATSSLQLPIHLRWLAATQTGEVKREIQRHQLIICGPPWVHVC